MDPINLIHSTMPAGFPPPKPCNYANWKGVEAFNIVEYFFVSRISRVRHVFVAFKFNKEAQHDN